MKPVARFALGKLQIVWITAPRAARSSAIVGLVALASLPVFAGYLAAAEEQTVHEATVLRSYVHSSWISEEVQVIEGDQRLYLWWVIVPNSPSIVVVRTSPERPSASDMQDIRADAAVQSARAPEDRSPGRSEMAVWYVVGPSTDEFAQLHPDTMSLRLRDRPATRDVVLDLMGAWQPTLNALGLASDGYAIARTSVATTSTTDLVIAVGGIFTALATIVLAVVGVATARRSAELSARVRQIEAQLSAVEQSDDDGVHDDHGRSRTRWSVTIRRS